MRKLLQNIFIASMMTILLAGSTGLISSTPTYAQSHSSQTVVAQATDIEQTTPPTDTVIDESTDPDRVPTPASTCESSFVGIGWLLCQVTRAIYGVFNYLVTEVLAESLLEIEFVNEENDLRAIWAGFRTLANLVFVILFLVIIYAEASGRFALLETYSLTRILPRLFLSVIGIQLSFFIVAYTIGFFNDMGRGVADLMLSPLGGYSQFDFANGNDGVWFGLPITEIGEDFLDNLIAIPVVFAVGIAAIILLPTILSFGALGLALLLLTLIARKIIIIALIVVSPIAFAAFALPGTEKIFKLWWDTFSKALMMYPLIMIFIASGQLLGRLALVGDNVTFMDSMIGFIATFLPLFMIPITFRLAGQAIGGIAGGLNNANEKLKGDVRDPNSMRARVRRNRLQSYGRHMQGHARTPNSRFLPGPLRNKATVPTAARNAYNRLPGTNSSTGLIADYDWGREMVGKLSSTLGDDVFRAATVTGGGRLKGFKVNTADGGRVWSGYAKLGKHLGYNDDGSIMTRNGIAQVLDKRASDVDSGRFVYKDASNGDFYDRSVMLDVYKYGNNRGFVAASNEYTMTKSNMTPLDEDQVWRGLNATRFTADEKNGMAQGVWYNTKDASLHHKFGDFNEMFTDGTNDYMQEAAKQGDPTVATRGMKLKFQDLTEYFHKQMEQYPATNQKHTFWKAVNDNFDQFAQDNNINNQMSAQDFHSAVGNNQLRGELEGMAWKARGVIHQSREAMGGGGQRVANVDPDGNPQMIASGSGASGASAEQARRFLQLYRQHVGELPGGEIPDL